MNAPAPGCVLAGRPGCTVGGVTVRTPSKRIVQGVLLLAGAVVLELLAGEERIRFYWTPLIIGLIYLAAALAGGRRGGYWATACGLIGWGLAVVLIARGRPHEIDTAGAYLAGAGIGFAAGALLRRAGVAVSDLGLGLTVAAAGAVLALTPRADFLGDATNYAIAVGAVGLANCLAGAVLSARGTREEPAAG